MSDLALSLEINAKRLSSEQQFSPDTLYFSHKKETLLYLPCLESQIIC